MELFQWGSNPWGQETLVRISWDLLYLAFWAGVAFILFHIAYAVVWLPRLARASAGAAAGGDAADVPARIVRHTSAARFFHWVMAAAMIALLVTGFFPIVGIQFPWVTIHWISGVLLTISILYHIVHATFFLDFWSIWILPSDLAEAWHRMRRQAGQSTPPIRKHGKYPLDHKLYHLAVTLAGLAVIGTGLVLMLRIDSMFWPRNAYLLADETWGLMYVIHGLGSVLFVTLTLTHIYFAVRPEKFWLTKSMILGYVDRDRYLEHHDPDRWVVSQESKKG
jgi:cytochrome b subunit of formate dehydrogenase